MIMLYKNSKVLGDSEGSADAFILDAFIFRMVWLQMLYL